MPKKSEQPRPEVDPPSLYPIDEALITIFSDNPADQESPAATASFLSDDDWMNDGHSDRDRDEGTASAASRTEGAARATTQPATERSEPNCNRGTQPHTQLADPTAMQAFERTHTPPARDAELLKLPAWMRRYVLGLRQFGVCSLAARHANVSRQFVSQSRKASPEFDQACHDAERDSLDYVEAATIQSATVGDVQPVFQGGYLVGHKRVKNVKAAELLFQKAGYLEDKPPAVEDSLKVAVVTDAEMAARLQETMQRLFAARQQQPLLDAETGRPVQ